MSFLTDDILSNSDLNQAYMEMHNISYFYHWGADEVYHLPCSKRGVFNDLIKHQLKAETSKVPTESGSLPKKPYKEGG